MFWQGRFVRTSEYRRLNNHLHLGLVVIGKQEFVNSGGKKYLLGSQAEACPPSVWQVYPPDSRRNSGLIVTTPSRKVDDLAIVFKLKTSG